ncbi:precorrin-6A/cobalt-precorrin-6A reductase, partial [Streptomyces sp. NPDC005811]|uniref:precorrin-6A/cobalt-precorrin-6A reductase n=1 Tax=Streptomyces sp. NPDC005811 TaxID=3154565 RepID=UPI0033E20163
PEFAGPEFAGPELVGSEFVGSEFAGSELAGPEFAGPEFAGPELVGSEFVGSEFAGSELAGPNFAGPEFAGPGGLWFLVRCVEPPEGPRPARAEILLDRGPFTLDGERELLRRHRIDVVVTKDSGGAATAPKLTAAREAGLPVVVVRRPPLPEGVPVTPTPEAAARWVAAQESRTAG